MEGDEDILFVAGNGENGCPIVMCEFGRYRVLDGVVYEAHDRTRDEIVALKTLLHAEANALYRFKREFRTLADTHHRNLVALHELFVDDQQCFFTMERVVGLTFLEHVRPEAGPAASDPTGDDARASGTQHPATLRGSPCAPRSIQHSQ